MPRAYWKGYLRLSLVTCPIELFPASSQAEKTHFHQINTQDRQPPAPADGRRGNRPCRRKRPKGTRLRTQQGHATSRSRRTSSKAVEIESTHTVDIDSFVPEDGDRQALSRQALLHRAGRQERRGGVRRHPRRHEGQGPRGAGADRDGESRAHHRAGAARQRPARHDAALRLRSARREGLLQRHSAAAHPQGHGQDSPSTSSTAKAGHFDAAQVQGRVRKRAEEAGQAQGRRQDDRSRRAGGAKTAT